MDSNSASAPTPSATEETTAEAEGDSEPRLEVETGAKPFTNHPADLQFSPGTRFKLGELTVELAHCLSLDRIVVTELRTGETRVVTRGDLRPVNTNLDAQVERSVELESLSEEQLADLTAREELLKPYISGRVMSSLEAQLLAKKIGVSARTLRRWLRRYQRRGDVTGLLPAPRGVRLGQRSLDPSVEAIIRFAVTRKLEGSGNCSVRSVYERIRGDCDAIGKPVPARKTILERIKDLKADPEVLPPEVGRHVRDRTRLVRGSAEAARALARVEIDHTLVDTHIVDAKDRGPLGRPWLTIAIDVATRVILGFVLTLEHPSRLSVALCLRHAIFPKEDWLRSVRAAGCWPMFGRPEYIYTDNGAEFRSPSFIIGCKRQHIQNGWRPPRTPRYGGTVERHIGTFMRRMRLIPGNTFNEILSKRSPYPAQDAVLTLDDLQLWLTNEIIAYHNEPHRTLDMAPIAAWEAAWKNPRGVVVPPHPTDPHTLFTDMLPHDSRVISPKGIELNSLRYRCDELTPYVNPDVKRIVRIDPRDISAVWLELPTGGYLKVPWINQGWPRMSLWEWNEIRSRNRKRGKGADPEVVRCCLAANDELIEQRAAQGQLRARRRRARGERWRLENATEPREAVNEPTDTVATQRRKPRRRQTARKPAEGLPPLPRTQLEVTTTSIESPVSFEVLE
jgi:putative transposase